MSKCLPNGEYLFGLLSSQQSAVANSSLLKDFEQLVSGTKIPGLVNFDDLAVDEARALEDAHGFFMIAKTEERRARRKLNRKVAMCLDGLLQESESDGFIGTCPDGEADAAASPQNAVGLPQSDLRLPGTSYVVNAT